MAVAVKLKEVPEVKAHQLTSLSKESISSKECPENLELLSSGSNVSIALKQVNAFVKELRTRAAHQTNWPTSYDREEVQNLLASIAQNTSSIINPFAADRRETEIYNPQRAFDVAKLAFVACDRYLRNHLNKTYGSAMFSIDRKGEVQIGMYLVHAPELVKDRLAHFPIDLVSTREHAIFATYGSVDLNTKIVLELMSTLVVYMELGSSTLYGVTQNIFPVHAYQAGLKEGLSVLCRNSSDKQQKLIAGVSLQEVIESINYGSEFWKSQLTNLPTGGSLSAPAWGRLTHQTRVGLMPLELAESVLGEGANVAHAEETPLKNIEIQLTSQTQKFFGQGWEQSLAVTTSGGTSSNKIALDISVDSLGAGLALKKISLKFKLKIEELENLSDEKALLMSQTELSKLIQTCGPKQLKILHKHFRKTLKAVHKINTPLIVKFGNDWTHYTLENCINELNNTKKLIVPLNERYEADFEYLKDKISALFREKGKRPILIPITFCNTGLGRVGFDPQELLNFDSWLKEQGVNAIYNFDAAQGGITFGISESQLDPKVAAAQKVIKKLASFITIDPHKYDRKVATSLLVTRFGPLASFINSPSINPSYIQCGDIATVRGKVHLSASPDALINNAKYIRALEDKTHAKRFTPVLSSAKKIHEILSTQTIKIYRDGCGYRLYPITEPHSGIIGIILVPLEQSVSFEKAQEALKKLYSEIRKPTNALTCSKYELKSKCFKNRWVKLIEDLSNRTDFPISAKDTKKITCLRLVCRAANQENILEEFQKFETFDFKEI